MDASLNVQVPVMHTHTSYIYMNELICFHPVAFLKEIHILENFIYVNSSCIPCLKIFIFQINYLYNY